MILVRLFLLCMLGYCIPFYPMVVESQLTEKALTQTIKYLYEKKQLSATFEFLISQKRLHVIDQLKKKNYTDKLLAETVIEQGQYKSLIDDLITIITEDQSFNKIITNLVRHSLEEIYKEETLSKIAYDFINKHITPKRIAEELSIKLFIRADFGKKEERKIIQDAVLKAADNRLIASRDTVKSVLEFLSGYYPNQSSSLSPQVLLDKLDLDCLDSKLKSVVVFTKKQILLDILEHQNEALDKVYNRLHLLQSISTEKNNHFAEIKNIKQISAKPKNLVRSPIIDKKTHKNRRSDTGSDTNW